MFGTLKRQRGFTFTLMRGKEKMPGEVGFMFIGYNLSRCISVLGAEKLIQALRKRSVALFSWSLRLVLSFFKQFWVKSQIHMIRLNVKINALRILKIHSVELSLIWN